MSPAAYRRRGDGVAIGYAVVPCSLGRLLVAATPTGVCAVRLGSADRPLVEELRREFPKARVSESAPPPAWTQAIARAVDGAPGAVPGVPLDVQGTAFQWKVWKALQAIPAGQTRTYAEVAEAVGRPHGGASGGERLRPQPGGRWWCRATGWCPKRAGSAVTAGALTESAPCSAGRAGARTAAPPPAEAAAGPGRPELIRYNPPSMNRTRYGVSPWTLAPTAKSRVFPTAPTLEEADVVVVGGGLTGLLTAWGLKTAGRGVVLLDAGRLGAGHSGAASGLTGLLTTNDYRALETMHGRRLARTLMTAVAEAGPSLAAAMKKAKAVVKFEPRPLLSLVDVAAKGWDRDAVAREAAGLEAKTLSGTALSRATSAEVAAATRLAGAGLIEPARVDRRGRGPRGRRSRAGVRAIARDQDHLHAHRRHGARRQARPIRASRVVICTDAPGALAPTLDRHVRAVERFHVLTAPMPAAMRKAMALGQVVVGDVTAPFTATTTADGRLLLTGGDGPLLARAQARRGADAAHRRPDVPMPAAFSGDGGPGARVRLVVANRRRRRTASRSSARTASTRTSSSRSAPTPIPRWRGWRAESSSEACSARPPRPMSRSASGACKKSGTRFRRGSGSGARVPRKNCLTELTSPFSDAPASSVIPAAPATSPEPRLLSTGFALCACSLAPDRMHAAQSIRSWDLFRCLT